MLAVRKILTNNKNFTSVKYLENSVLKTKKREEIFKRTIFKRNVCSPFRTDFAFKKNSNVIVIYYWEKFECQTIWRLGSANTNKTIC